MYLIGTGVTRSLYELTAHALLFDLQVEAGASALEARALKAGTNTEAQAVDLDYARRIIEMKAYEQGKHLRLQVEAGIESLDPVAST